MAEEAIRPPRRRRRRHVGDEDVTYGPAPLQVHPSIASLRGRHRAAHPDTSTILEAASHLLMFQEWPIYCPRFMHAIRVAGLDSASQLRYIRLDHHLLTALVERWSPQTNTFHLAIGEMTVTLQDVAMILGVQIDGPPLVGPVVVGVGKRWESWPICCDELLGQHPLPDTIYRDPLNPERSSKFRMGQAHAKTCMPLRWLRWTFFRDSYIELSEIEFIRHVRAYILFMIGSFLLPDTSGSEVHLQYLPMLENIEYFNQISIGGAVLAHLYRELKEATKPKRANIAGCLHLLQIWSWEHIHVGRPTHTVPYPTDLDGLSIGFRWNASYVREMPVCNTQIYRDELDGLLQSQVIWEPYGNEIRSRLSNICLVGEEIWQARVPLICWKRVEWHLPDRVLRQFGYPPRRDVEPIDPQFIRVDGRGKADVDWADYHQAYISLWDSRRSCIIAGVNEDVDREHMINSYMKWYRSWASLYLLKAPTEAPIGYYPKAPQERLLRDYYLDVEEIFQPFYGRDDQSALQLAVNKFEELSTSMRRQMYITDTRYRDMPNDEVSHEAGAANMGAGPSTFVDPEVYTYSQAGPSTYPATYPPQGSQGVTTMGQSQLWPTFDLQYGGVQGAYSQQSHTPITPSPYGIHAPYFMPTSSIHMAPHYSGHPWGTTEDTPNATSLGIEVLNQDEEVQEHIDLHVPHQLRDRPIRPPEHYTPGTDALPQRHRRRR